MKLVDLDNSWGESILQDWYIYSVNPDDEPQWTEAHIEELCNDFYVIPKETPITNVREKSMNKIREEQKSE